MCDASSRWNARLVQRELRGVFEQMTIVER